MNLAKYSKCIVALLGTVVIVVQTQFAASSWAPIVIAAATALGTYFAPNSAGKDDPK